MPVLVLRGMMAFLQLLSFVWAGATCLRYFAEFIQVQPLHLDMFVEVLCLCH